MKSIAQIVIGLPVEGPFDYKIPQDLTFDLAIGQRVIVPFGRRHEMGYVTGFVEKSAFSSLKEIRTVLDSEPILSSELIRLAQWMSVYYGCSLGEALEKMVPFSVRQRKKLDLKPYAAAGSTAKFSIALFLAYDDEKALQEIFKHSSECLKNGQGVLYLAPDHMRSQRIVQRASKMMGWDFARLDLGTSKQQAQDWVALKNGELRCVMGLRSAVFAPVKNLGLVVVFDEHHYGYKEDQSPFYHAREVILKRAKIEGFQVIFVSPAPTVELWSEVKDARVFAKDNAAEIKLIDLANYKPKKDSALSFPSANAVSRTLDEGGNVLVLFNRRGFHTVIKCEQCGYTLKCERCQMNFIYHADVKKMICPSCDGQHELAQKCPQCDEKYLHHYGDGIERIENDLSRFFPQANVATFDRESKRIPKRAKVLVATQAVSKMLDQLTVDVAVVLDADAELSRHDFRCHQAVLSLLMDLKKVTRREVYVQTRQPDHPSLRYAQSMDLKNFYQQELKAREDLGFPPSKHLFEIMVRAKKEIYASEQADMIYEIFLEHPSNDFEVMPPQPGFPPKLRDQYRYIIMGKGADAVNGIAHIKSVLKEIKKKSGVIVTINVDP